MENKFYTSKTRIALIVVLTIILAVSMGLAVYMCVADNPAAFAAESSYTLITDMPSNLSTGAGFNVDGTTYLGDASTAGTIHIVDGDSVVVRPNVANVGGVFGNFYLASLYMSQSASTNWTRVASDTTSYTITELGTYYFVTIVDCYSDASHSTITNSYRSTYVFSVTVANTDLPVAPTKTGYTFTGWYTDSACTILYEEDTITSDITLYAGFRPNTYTIVFNGNASDVYSGMASLAMTYDTAKNLTKNGFVRDGYAFAGWATETSGSVVYSDQQSVINLTATDGATVNLYAVWTAVEYTVHFNGNGNTSGTMSDETLQIDVAQKLTSNAFVKTGYKFAGWATSASGSVAYADGASVTNIGSAGSTVNLYAVWTAITFTIRFNGNFDGVSGTMSNQTVTYDTTTALKANAFSKTGYNFLGWATSASGSVVYADGADITNLTSVDGKTIDLYAVWEIVRCKVTFIVDNEILVVVTVDYGTSTDEVVGQAVNSILYTVSSELPN